MKYTNIFTNLGLSEQETGAYISLLKIGGSIASAVAKEMGVKRTTVYPILQSLANKGFVTVYFRKNRRFYYAQKPHKLSRIFENKLNDFNNIIPFLGSMEKKQAQSMGLRFVETVDELKRFYDDILDELQSAKIKEYYIIGNTNAWEEVGNSFIGEFRKNRAKLNIKTKLLLTADSEKINPLDKSLMREYKYLPEKYQFKSTIDIFKDKVLIVSPELSSLAVVIAIPAMVDVFKSIFEIIWDLVDSDIKK